ncbi:hypothetical protein [Streptosporangium lutulentum]|uniref:Uncharacterized protein n=1 Tax=Streptosporangium lutulentum TaxID=1461250 RepID=A0ABT9QGK0_9ACTN|nr:hypothetical protein [Streptosporangium lutulentum]MDP9845891.1 hypothetical protein [Streptosporangium lutulentum]
MKTFLRTLFAGGVATAVVLSSGMAADAAAYPRYEAPKTFGTTLQADPGHDFTKRISPRRNGILRGWVTYVSGTTVEYEPIRWKKGTQTEGWFVGPPENDAMAYSSRVARGVVFLSASGCKVSGGEPTLARSTGLGAKRCSRAVLLKRYARSGHPSLITVYRGEIVKVQEIFTP